MVFTARSYARMAAAYPVAGSTYAYTQRTFGAPIGFLAGWSLLLDYLLLPMLNYLVIGIYLNAAIPAVPAWVFVLITIVIVTVLNIVGIVSVARANVLIIALQAVFIVVFLVLAVVTLSHSGTVDLMAPLTGDGSATGLSPILAGAAILCLSFLGFDVDAVGRGQRPDPQRAAGDHDRNRYGGCAVRCVVVHLAVGLPVQPIRGCRLGLPRRDENCWRTVLVDVLHGRLRCRRTRLGDHVPGVGRADPVRNGPRRHPVAAGCSVTFHRGSPPRPIRSLSCR